MRLGPGALLVAATFAGCGSSDAGTSGGNHSQHAGGSPSQGRLRSEGGHTLEVSPLTVAPARPFDLALTITGPAGKPVRDFEVEQDKRLHLILVRRDLTSFQHVHPRLGPNGVWRLRMRIPRPGPYRLYADYKTDGRRRTLSTPIVVDGAVAPLPFGRPRSTVSAGDGYRVTMRRDGERITFAVGRRAQAVGGLERYLGSKGHLVALRLSDLAYLHTHPVPGARGNTVPFDIELTPRGAYRLFFQFRHGGRVHTAAFTVGRPGKAGAPELPVDPGQGHGHHH